MTGSGECAITGRWRIVASDLWTRDHLDLLGPAFAWIGSDGGGELCFGAMTADLRLEYSRTVVFFTFAGSDEGEAVSGSGSAELAEDGSLAIEISFASGDNAELQAVRGSLRLSR